ncbi:MAG: glycosyltransferase, partial [Candidatus Marinimicrobia bacterium]|nr:glycosyltransferase [Candidatus Neomarinimicrobiota bacterium]
MKILYISPENTVGTLGLWKRLHELRGNYCRTVTLFPSDLGFADDICLKLPLVGPMPWYRRLRNMAYQRSKGPLGDLTDLPGNPPVWQPGNGAERAFFAIRDWLWRFKVEPAIKKYDLLDFDVYHFEWGMEFYRHGGFVKRLEQLGKPMIAHYHGQDFRNRGVIPAVDSRVRASLTSEYDLIPRHTNMRYLFLPYDVSAGKPKTALHDPITICHATRSRYFKGSDKIIDVCQRLEKSHGIRFILIENQPHAETMELKRQADIYVDQIADVAPGYGMNSVETMALGVACCTSMDDAYQQFMPGHPFINVNAENLEKRLLELVQNPGRIMEYGRKAREWAEKRHSLEAVGDQL